MVGRTGTRCRRCGLGLSLWLLGSGVGAETLPTLELLEFLGSGDEYLVADMPKTPTNPDAGRFEMRHPADVPPRWRPEPYRRPEHW